MSSETLHSPEKLLARIEYLEENRRFIQNVLESALSLVDFQENILNSYGPENILEESEKRIRYLIPFEADALYLVNQDTSDFQMAVCMPPEMREFLAGEVEHMIDKGFFAWAIRERRGVTIASRDGTPRLVLHVIVTHSRIRGMFVGVMDDSRRQIPDLDSRTGAGKGIMAQGGIPVCAGRFCTAAPGRPLPRLITCSVRSDMKAHAGRHGEDKAPHPPHPRATLPEGDESDSRAWRLQSILSPPLGICYAVVLSLLAFDLIMSLDPHWVSTLFGAYYFMGSFYTALAVLVVLSYLAMNFMGMHQFIKPQHFHDLGKLLFAFCLVTGISFIPSSW